jgi:hypothetical protein
MQTVRDVLARKGLQPIVIHRTQKRGGHLVLRSSALPVETVGGTRGAFAGKSA